MIYTHKLKAIKNTLKFDTKLSFYSELDNTLSKNHNDI